MADSFFGFNTSLTALERDGAPDLDDEEEYDALNHETFGENAFQGDWEEDHTRFAEVTENSRTHRNSFKSDKDDDLDLEVSISQWVLEGEEEEEEEEEVEVEVEVEEEEEEEDDIDEMGCIRPKTSKSINIPHNFKMDSRGIYNSSSVCGTDSPKKQSGKHLHQSLHPPQLKSSSMQFLPPQIPRIPTVQELERDLIQKNKQNKAMDKELKGSSNLNHVLNQGRNVNANVSLPSNLNVLNSNVQPQNVRSKFTYTAGNNKYPPGFCGPPQRPPFLQPPQQEMVFLRNNINMPMLLGPRVLPPYRLPNSHPLMLPQNPRLVPPHMMRFMPPPHPILMQPQQQHQQQYQHQQQQQQPPQQQHQQQYQHQQHQQQQQQQHHPQHQSMHQTKTQHRSNQASQPKRSSRGVDGYSQDNKKNNSRNNINNSGHVGQSWMQNPDRRGAGDFDEYAGLMNLRERQWLRNIQLIQITSAKPYGVDYYFNEWLKKQEKENKNKEQIENGMKNKKQHRESFFGKNRQNQNDGGGHRDRKDSERESLVSQSPKVYEPLQFENSLGKLQCVSVSAPRKIIDWDVVSEPQADPAPAPNHRDSGKTKKLLLELERLHLMAVDIECIENNIPIEEEHLSKPELLDKIMSSFLNENRFVNFMSIRKGKTLLLRILKYLDEKERSDQLSDLWYRIIKSFSTILRRGYNDRVLLLMYPYFKKWISTTTYVQLSLLASLLLPGNTFNHVKSPLRAGSPSSGKSILSVALYNKFGVSVISVILSQGEDLYPDLKDNEQLDWKNFVFNFTKHISDTLTLGNISAPLEPLKSDAMCSILTRSTGLNIQEYASVKRVLSCFV